MISTPLALEAEILVALDVPKRHHETRDAEFRRKEHELGAVFARLTPADSLALEKRLKLSLAGDPIAERFSRLTADRRDRLIGFLSAVRRRHPLQRINVGAHHE
ncbi:MAG: hypothetical protein ABI704_11970 [Kofleriaceae bacterium]